MQGAGNANVNQRIQHDGKFVRWHYIYFGYSKPQNRAYAYVKWASGENSLNFPNTNHYYISKFYMWVPKERFYAAFSGKIGYLNLNFGDGAFRDTNKYDHPDDIFAYGEGYNKLVANNVKEVNVQEAGLINVAYDQDSPKVVELNDNQIPIDRDEYGYGFWFRFLYRYPSIVLPAGDGMSEFFFLSRLTSN